VKLSGGPWGGVLLTGGFLDDKDAEAVKPCWDSCLSFVGHSVQVFCGFCLSWLVVYKKVLCSSS
jgi:hypothetical protein